LVPILRVVFIELGEASAQSGVIDQNIDVSPIRGKIGDCRLYLTTLPYIELEVMHCRSAGGRERLPKLLQRARPAGTEKQARSFPREGNCGCSANTGTRPGDEHGLSL